MLPQIKMNLVQTLVGFEQNHRILRAPTKYRHVIADPHLDARRGRRPPGAGG
jgi:hypothetical protein